jgi:hypothetical protein
MRVDAKGRVAAGAGDGSASVDNIVIGRGGSPCFLDNAAQEVVYGSTKDGREDKVIAYSLVTKQPRVLAEGGASLVKAGGNRWARYLADGRTGLTDSTGFAGPRFGLHDVGPDGVLYYKPNPERGIVARFPNGAEVVISSSEQPLSLRGVNDGCIWTRPNLTVGVWKLPPPRIPDGLGVYSPCAALIRGEWWLAYGDGRRILAQPFSSDKGYVVADLGNTFDLDCVARGDRLRVAYALTQGEQPGQWLAPDLDLTRPRVDLRRVTVPVPAPTPTPSEGPGTPPANGLKAVKKWREFYDRLPEGDERAFLVTNGAAWDMRDQGAGLLDKRSGNNYRGYSTDCVIFRSGYMVDVLSDGEGAARPQWSFSGPHGASGTADASNWRSPIDPSTLPGWQTQTPTPSPPDLPPGPVDLKASLIAIRGAIDDLLARL